MAKVEIYGTRVCPFCDRAKELLKRKNIEFTEYKIDEDMDKRQEMVTRNPGARTVPQIFINDKAIGGFDDLNALSNSGELDKILNDN